MARLTMQVVKKLPLSTPNRGVRAFIISLDSKGRYFAHEVGNLTQWAEIFGGVDRMAHRINGSRRWGNQYGHYWIVKPFRSYNEALTATMKAASTSTIFC